MQLGWKYKNIYNDIMCLGHTDKLNVNLYKTSIVIAY